MTGSGVLGAAAFYRPLVMWADNAWDLSSPYRVLAFGLLLLGISMVPYLALVIWGFRPVSAGILVGGLVYAAANWHQLAFHPLAWVITSVVAGVASNRWLRSEGQKWLALVVVVPLTVAPLTQLVLSHIQKSESYPVIDTGQPLVGSPTGDVEDIVILVIDSYPSLAVAEAWFQHDVTEITDSLGEAGFTVEQTGWSQHSFTGLAVPALLELRPVVEPGPKGQWGNRRDLYDMVRGDNFLANSLRSSGYHYTHIESGWDGASCGEVDTCLESRWIDEAIWQLLEPSLVSAFLVDRYGSFTVPNSIRVVENLESIRSSFGDSELDFVFAHMLLPHAPLVVDESCQLVNGSSTEWSESSGGPLDLDGWRDQLTCVDLLIGRVADLSAENTAIVITSDHGTATRGQLGTDPDSWSDAEIAERLGVFLAYRLPPACPEPESSVSTDVIRTMVGCAVDLELPERDERFLLGADHPIATTETSILRLQSLLREGSLAPSD